MKKHILFFAVMFSFFSLFAQPEIKMMSYFRVEGVRELRSAPNFKNETLLYTTLNHEGGLKVRALVVGKTDVYKTTIGRWYNIILTTGQWASGGDWIPPYQKFWLFLPEDTVIYDYEE